MDWKASWALRTGENEEKKDNDKIKPEDQNGPVNAHLISWPSKAHGRI